MSSPSNPGVMVNTVGAANAPLGAFAVIPVIQPRAPGVLDVKGSSGPYKIGQSWVNTVSGGVYILTRLAPVAGVMNATWTLMGTAAGTISTLTGDSGGAISPSAGNINLLGTANQIVTTGSGSTITWSLSPTMVAPGSLTVTSGFTVSAGAITLTSGTSAINISTDAAATTVSVGTGAAAKTVVLGSTNTTSTTTIQSGSGGINLAGVLALAATTGPKIQFGTGAPAGATTAGSIYLRTDGATADEVLYVNFDGAGASWAALAT